MTLPPPITDRTALSRIRLRAGMRVDHAAAMFLHHSAIADLQERLVEVNKSFTRPAIVTGFPDLWLDAFPDAICIPDADHLDLIRGAHDLVIHAMALHWANDPLGQIVQCRLALAPDGLFLAVFPGGQTLSELRIVLAQAEAAVSEGLSPRVLPMAEIREVGALLQRAGLALPVADSFTTTVIYGSFSRLMADLRAMGETNALAGRLRRPTGGALFRQAEAIYSDLYGIGNDQIRATFELICLTGWAPHESQQIPLKPGSAKQSLAAALNTTAQHYPTDC